MPTVAQIREAIRVKAAAVADAGTVNDYERYHKDASKLLAMYLNGARLSGGFIALRASERTSPGLGRFEVTHRWELRFFRSLDDADVTEKTFDTMLEAQAAAFQLDENLGGLISSTVLGGDGATGPAGLQIREKVPALFCGVLCHSARAELFTRHEE